MIQLLMPSVVPLHCIVCHGFSGKVSCFKSVFFVQPTTFDLGRPHTVIWGPEESVTVPSGLLPLLLSFSQAELPSQTNLTGLVNLAFTWSSHFCPSECLAALGHPCWSVRVTHGWWVLSFHMGWKQHLLFQFQLPCAYRRGLKNTVGRTQNIVTKAASISIFFPLLPTLQPTWTTHSIHTQCFVRLCLHSARFLWTLFHPLLGSLPWCSFFKAQIVCHLLQEVHLL